MSRQREWQIKKMAAGICVACGRKRIARDSASHCVDCRAVRRAREKLRMRKINGGHPWRKGGPGRPPK